MAHGSSTQDQRFAATKALILGWLATTQLRITEKDVEGAAWVVACEDEAGRSFSLGQGLSTPDKVDIQEAVLVADSHLRGLARLKPKERDAFLWDLRFLLLALGVEQVGAGHPFRQVTIMADFYPEGATQHEFFQCVRRVQRGTTAVVWSIFRLVGQTPNETPPVAVN